MWAWDLILTLEAFRQIDFSLYLHSSEFINSFLSQSLHTERNCGIYVRRFWTEISAIFAHIEKTMRYISA